jgi:hypothetical protein
VANDLPDIRFSLPRRTLIGSFRLANVFKDSDDEAANVASGHGSPDYLFSGGLGGTVGGRVGATGCGSLLTPAAIGMSRQSNE